MGTGSQDGVLVVDKPAGPTSHDVVERVRRALGVRKAGHTGTLDPFATGVLAVCLGRATRLARFLSGGEKVYRTSVRLGFATTTDDLDGEPIEPRLDATAATPEEIRAACAALVGPQLQLPPAFSAKRIAGRRAYAVARSGGTPQVVAVPVTVHQLELLAVRGDQVDLEASCSPGTYVRALARDLGQRLGLGGHLVSLRRTRNGPFQVADAVPLDNVGQAGQVLPLSALLGEMPAVIVVDEGQEALRHGRDLPPHLVRSGFPTAPGRVRLLGEDGELLALGLLVGAEASLPRIPAAPVIHADVVLIGPKQ